MDKYIKYIIVIINSICSFMLILSLFIFNNALLSSDKIVIDYKNIINEKNEYNISINYNDNQKVYCSLDRKQWLDNCNINLKKGSYKIFVKNNNTMVYKDFVVKEKYEGSFTSNIDELETYYLALNGTKKISFKFNYPDNFDKKVYLTSSNNDIVSVNEDGITGVSAGTATITATLKDGNSKQYKVLVTDIIVPEQINPNKKNVPCGIYTEEENILLDKILESRIKEAGFGTRAGVTAAARFLTLEFPYHINYYGENGRLTEHGLKAHIDGEGRYYHYGLYLNESKYKTIEVGARSADGPKMWGCDLYNYAVRRSYANGLDCSGFVTWAMYNGGFDVGDVGAGDFPALHDDLSDLGPHKQLTYDFMKNGKYKVGDFIARNGHAALIIGIDENNIYTAESLNQGLRAKTYERYRGIVDSPTLSYVIDMDNIYPNGEGNYSIMW